MAEPFSLRIRVRGYELDAQGHVNQAVFTQYAEHARWECLRAAGVPHDDLVASGVGPALLKTTMRFRHELPAAYLRDAVAVMQGGLVDDLNGAALPLAGGGWGYGLILGMYNTPPASPPEDAVLAALSPGAELDERQELPYLAWLFRLDALWDQLQETGHWRQAKPRFTVFVAADRASELAEAVLAELTPDDLGAGGVRLSPVNAAAIRQPLFMLPGRSSPAFELSVGRFPAPDHPDVAGLLAQNRRFYDRAVAVGAKRYLYGAIPDMTTADWQRHYGSQWTVFADLKERYDPDQVLTPGQRIFG